MSKEIGFVYNKAKKQKLPYFYGEEEKILSFATNPDYQIRIFADEGLDELAYLAYATAAATDPDVLVPSRAEFFEQRTEARKGHAKLLKKFEALARKIREKTGRDTRIFDAADGKITLVVDTNYEGMYPTKETFEDLHKIEKIASRAGYNMDTHSAKVGCYITKEV